MKISFFGHCAFYITLNSGTTLLIDPYGNPTTRAPWFNQPFPALAPDFLIITHPHYDHNGVETIMGLPTVIRHPVRVETNDFVLQGIEGRHSRDLGAEFGYANTMFSLRADGINLCIWGDNEPKISPEQQAMLGKIDVMTITVEDKAHLLDFDEIDNVIAQLQPSVVIPTHYAMAGLNPDGFMMDGIDSWLSEQEQVRLLPGSEVELTLGGLPAGTQIWHFETWRKSNV